MFFFHFPERDFIVNDQYTYIGSSDLSPHNGASQKNDRSCPLPIVINNNFCVLLYFSESFRNQRVVINKKRIKEN